MNKIKTLAVVLGISTFVSANIFAAPNAKEMVNEKYWAELSEKGEIQIIHEQGDDESVLFPKSEAVKIFNSHRISKDPKGVPFFLENLFLLNKSDLLAAGKSGASDITLDDISKVFRSVSKMEGMTYYSQRLKKDTVLYEHAYTIKSADDTTKIDDINTGNADGQVSYSYQDDNSFGPCRYELHYYHRDGCLYAIFNNLDAYKLMGISGINPKNMNINAVAFDCGDQLLLYLSADVSAQKVPGVRKQIMDSMCARITAIANWFKKQF